MGGALVVEKKTWDFLTSIRSWWADFKQWLGALIAVGTGFFALNQILRDPEQAKRAFPVLVAFGGAVVAAIVGVILVRFISGLQRDSHTYAQNISRRDTASDLRFKWGPIEIRSQGTSRPLGGDDDESSGAAPDEEPEPIDTSNPDALFKVSRQRLLDEAVRIDAISRRNLGIGILFSSIALAVLAWPLVSAAFYPPPELTSADLTTRGILRTYLPRFSVGLLLQFVGFFFLRLYVANELDLKHNKNEITNIELKMMALQLSKEFDDAFSKKEIMKSLAQTERNFILKKNEKSVSIESLSEYNDLRGLVEKLVSKIPGAKDK
jgi:hypothetical protein